MESEEFIVLYTHQKMKKSKVWQDGLLKITHVGNKAILYDDKGECLDSIFLKCPEVKPGDDLESDHYLITVEEVKAAGSLTMQQNVIKEAPALNSRRFISSGRSLGCQPAGLKRKFTGFQGPRQVPKKMVITENHESATSLEAKKPGPVFLNPVYSTSPLFSTTGKKEENTTPTDPENTVTYNSTAVNAMPFSSVVTTPSFTFNPEMLREEKYFCSPGSSVDQHSGFSLMKEALARDGLASHSSGVSQNIRSKAQILALLKSHSTRMPQELNCETAGRFPQLQPQGKLKMPTTPRCVIEQEEYIKVKSTESLHHQQPSENTLRNTSRWSKYLSSRSSPVCSPTGDENTERKYTNQEESINLNPKDPLMQKSTQFFETCAEKGKNYNEDTLVDDDHFWDQEVNLQTPLFCETNSLRVTYSNVENDDLLLESGDHGNYEIPVKQNDCMRMKDSILIGENAQKINICGVPDKEYKQAVSNLPESEQLVIESFLSNNSQISDNIMDMLPNTGNQSVNSSHEPMCAVTQPLVEVTFNLTNFETSDTEEESQESNEIPQNSEGWVTEALIHGGHSSVQKRCEDTGCEEAGSEHSPPSLSTVGKPTEIFPFKEVLPSQFCDRTHAGFDTRPCNVADTGKETEKADSDSLNHFDSSLEWPDDAYVDNSEDANQPSQVRINYDLASLLNKPKGTKTNLHTLDLNMATNQTSKNNLSSEQAQSQAFILGSDLEKNDEQILLSTSVSDGSVQLLNPNQNHSEECIALAKSSSQVSNSLFYPLGKRHTISKDKEVYIPESEDLGRIRNLLHGPNEVETEREKHNWNNPRNSSELSELVNNISLLKSLSEHSTALEGLEILEKQSTTFRQQESLQAYEPESSPEARKPLTTVASQAIAQSPRLNQDSQQFFSLEGEEKPAFLPVLSEQKERKTSDHKPVQFQGHPVRGSASSAVMLRGPSSQLECSQFPESIEYGNCVTNTHFLTTELPSTCTQIDFLQFPGKENFSKRATGFNIEVMKKSSSLENKHLPRLPVVSRARIPLTTLPPADRPHDSACSYVIDCDRLETSGSSVLNEWEKSALLSFNFGPANQSETSFSKEFRDVTPGDVLLLDNVPIQSKWLKYQNITQRTLAAPDRASRRGTDGFFAEAVSEMHISDTGERWLDAVGESTLDAVHLEMMKNMLQQQQQQAFSGQDSISRKEHSLNLKQTSETEEIQNMLGDCAYYNYSVTGDLQEISDSELCFPSGQKIKSTYLPRRQICIPAVFESPTQYKQIFTSCLIEHLNILLFGLAQRLHKALSKVDISFYTSSKGEKPKNTENNVPSCHHQQPAKLVMVKKEGPNKGRLFYACDGPKADQCKFFKWFEAVTPGYLTQGESLPMKVLSDIKSIGLYLRSQKLPLYEECQLSVRKGFGFQRKQYGKLKKFTTINPEFYNEPKSKLYLKLSRKESSSTYSKNDLWVISKTLDFELDTFIACSAFFGPSAVNEVELLPLKGYFPSNWPTNTVVHALLVCNASTELTTLKNIQDHFNPATLPLMQYLLTMSSSATGSNKRVNKRKFIPPSCSYSNMKCELLSWEATLQLASEFIQAHKLNTDQAAALMQIAQMMASHTSAGGGAAPQTPSLPITIIHGVFGAGKSYLLAVVILFFVQLFEKSEAPTAGNARPWKLLISSSTNVAVDRVLLGLLSLGFEKFVRVGSIRKIAKPILPYSLHAGSENENEQLKELHALMKEDLTPVERVYVRKSIEQHKLGTNRALLKQVRVVGVTCAACPFPCMNELTFPVVVLDECSQMTEPASLLPIARFECEKLILVGDPKQLPPTIQGSDAAHENGLEQTLFDRLCLMGHKPVLLRTQYRCHPTISAIANDLFYEGHLINGISEAERSPLLEWLPSLCFYNVKGLEQIERDNSFHNVAEAAFTLKLIQSLIASGIAGSMIGVITLYKSQMHRLCHLLSAGDFDHPDIKAVQVSTVDAFQGAEKEVIILSCVRTQQVGFIDSEKRMNVALTRGRRHLLIVGKLACLRKNRLWGRVIQHCEGKKDGLQHADQFEPQLNHLLKDYFDKQAEEKQKKRSEKDKSKDKSHSQKDMVRGNSLALVLVEESGCPEEAAPWRKEEEQPAPQGTSQQRT
ncbi:protein ZGRF1 isoform X2 [Talpa occidentalis]|uniref:protein ZGRF1 isoform X2 n=1 Tax=Talpa occidentalis TaxID=50954 RepID=UPI0023F90AB7|nr:protein ZGRF1 isoform X2 [Talpa occidentalis]